MLVATKKEEADPYTEPSTINIVEDPTPHEIARLENEQVDYENKLTNDSDLIGDPQISPTSFPCSKASG